MDVCAGVQPSSLVTWSCWLLCSIIRHDSFQKYQSPWVPLSLKLNTLSCCFMQQAGVWPVQVCAQAPWQHCAASHCQKTQAWRVPGERIQCNWHPATDHEHSIESTYAHLEELTVICCKLDSATSHHDNMIILMFTQQMRKKGKYQSGRTQMHLTHCSESATQCQFQHISKKNAQPYAILLHG